MPVSTHLLKNESILKYLEAAESLTHLIVHLGVHECIDHIHRAIQMKCLVRASPQPVFYSVKKPRHAVPL